jgi:hypothetical protein
MGKGVKWPVRTGHNPDDLIKSEEKALITPEFLLRVPSTVLLKQRPGILLKRLIKLRLECLRI